MPNSGGASKKPGLSFNYRNVLVTLSILAVFMVVIMHVHSKTDHGVVAPGERSVPHAVHNHQHGHRQGGAAEHAPQSHDAQQHQQRQQQQPNSPLAQLDKSSPNSAGAGASFAPAGHSAYAGHEQFRQGAAFSWDKEVPAGFPMKPMTLESAGMCNPVHVPNVRGGYKAESGGTGDCKDRLKKRYIDSAAKLNAAFRSDERMKERHHLILQTFPTKDKPLVLMSFNMGASMFFANWVCYLEAQGMLEEIRAQTLVVTTDWDAYTLCSKLGFTAISPQFTENFQISAVGMFGNAPVGPHSVINSVNIMMMDELVNMGYDVLMQDVDIVWERNPLPWLQAASTRLDVLMMPAGRMDGRGPGNSGFCFIKSNAKTKIFTQTMVNLIPLNIYHSSDQLLWNELLHHRNFAQLHHENVPRALFLGLYMGIKELTGWPKNTPPPIILHFISTGTKPSDKKDARMKTAGVWKLDDTCKVASGVQLKSQRMPGIDSMTVTLHNATR